MARARRDNGREGGIRADQLLILGVAGLGAYAVYRLATMPPANGAAPNSENGQEPLPRPGRDVPILDTSLPELPGVAGAPPAGAITFTGPTVALDAQRWYGGRVETIPPVGRANVQTGRGELVAMLTDLGFAGSAVRPDAPEAAGLPLAPEVYTSLAEARASGRVPEYALAGAGRGTRWFYARWALGSQTMAKPPFVPLMWLAAPPQPRPVAVSGWYAVR